MTEQKNNILLGRTVFYENDQETKSWCCFEKTCSRSLIVILSQLFVILLIISRAFGEFIVQKLVTNQLFRSNFCVMQHDVFYPHQDCKQIDFYKTWRLHIIGQSIRHTTIKMFIQLAQKWNLKTKL